MSRSGYDRRQFLGLGAGAAGLFCSLTDATQVKHLSRNDVAQVDATAASLRKPRSAKVDAVDKMSFQTPGPQPGGQVREYWLQAVSAPWDPIPTGRDQWMGMHFPRKRFRAFLYQEMSPGFANPISRPSMPGPILRAQVGDVLRVHFRNADTHFDQAVTVHPHGVKYNPEYDGAYLGDFTRAGGFIAPGEEFTYTWEATEDSVGAWPYHDHGPNHVLNLMRGLFGMVVIYPRGGNRPDREFPVYLGSFLPQISGRDAIIHTVNGRAYAGNTPTFRSKVGDDVAFYVIGGSNDFHTWHIHGHRWKDSGGVPTDCPTVGPDETVVARFKENNPGRWLYHCHVFTHMDAGMAGWYLVDP